jgi:intraflagellar transport protein 57
LQYEAGFCSQKGKKAFSRIHFVYPGKNLSQQFDDFIDICSWLCMEISNQRDFFCRDPYDDPNTVSNKLMLALRQLEFKSSFPSQKLKQAHGEAVCSVLEFLTDKALEAKGFKWGVPVYSEAGQVLRYEQDSHSSVQHPPTMLHIFDT